MGINTQKIGVAVKVGRKILGFLTDIKDKLPEWARSPLQWGRDRGLWQRKGPGNFGGPHQ